MADKPNAPSSNVPRVTSGTASTEAVITRGTLFHGQVTNPETLWPAVHWRHKWDRDSLEGQHYCIIHKREATHSANGVPCCDPSLGGITMPCQVVEKRSMEITPENMKAWREQRTADFREYREKNGL